MRRFIISAAATIPIWRPCRSPSLPARVRGRVERRRVHWTGAVGLHSPGSRYTRRGCSMSSATQFINVSPVDESAPGRSSPVPGTPPLRQLVSAASDLVPVLRERAQAAERNCRVSVETMEDFRRAGIFRLMQPARYGGYEYGF